MGLQKNMNKDGQIYAYHKIGSIQIDEVNNRIEATMYNYATKEYRESSPDGYRSRDVRRFPMAGTLAAYGAMTADAIKEALYVLFKASDMGLPSGANPESGQTVEMNFYADANDVLEQE